MKINEVMGIDEVIVELEHEYDVLTEFGNVTKLSETIRSAIHFLKKYQEIEDIITCPLDIQEDVFRYKAICEVVGKKNITHGTYPGEEADK